MRLKRCFICLLLISALQLGAGSAGPGLRAQTIPGVGNITGLVNRAIKAIDLKIQRMQNKTIGLQNVQKVIENQMSKLHLQDIADWTARQKSLYAKYFEELGQVKGILTTYWKVKEMMNRQVQLVSEYKNAWSRLKNDPHFSVGELRQMEGIYTGILTESLRNLDQLTIVCSAITTQMSDGKRMQLITSAGEFIEENLADLRSFNGRNTLLSLSRAVDLADALTTRRVYGME